LIFNIFFPAGHDRQPWFWWPGFYYRDASQIQQARAWRQEKNLKYLIAVDGGIHFKTAVRMCAAGADVFVSGTGLFQHKKLEGGSCEDAKGNSICRVVDEGNESHSF